MILELLKLFFATEAEGAMTECGLPPFARIGLQVSSAELPADEAVSSLIKD